MTTIYLPTAASVLLAQRTAAILAEFDGHNARELANRHGLSEWHVYRLVAKARREDVALALQPNAESDLEVLSVTPLLERDFLSVIAAVHTAWQTAEAQGDLDRLVIALAILPTTHPAVAHPSTPAATASSPTGNPPSTPAHPDNGPTPADL